MSNAIQTATNQSQPLLVPAKEDRFGYFKILGISSVAFKVTSQDSKDLFVIEITLVQKGGPAKHVHFYQDEWF